MDTSIELSNVTFLRPGRTVLNHISMRIESGELVLIVGPTGSGKTTLLRLLLMDIFPNSGTVRVGEFTAPGISKHHIPKLRRNIGFVYQDFRLLNDRTVYENLSLFFHATNLTRRDEKKKILYALGDVGLAQKYMAYPTELSGGEQQRVAFARAMLNEPFLILADEPTGNLDARAEAQILDLIRTIHHRGTTVIITTHKETLANQLEGKIYHLDNGRISLLRES
jgi:cell division transport system ATP-binding protein